MNTVPGTEPEKKRGQWVALLPFVALAALVAVLWTRGDARPRQSSGGANAAAAEETAVSALLEAIDAKIAFHENRGSWLDLKQVASSYLGRAHLSGRFEDHARAREAVNAAIAAAPGDAGPHMLRARIALSTHQLETAELAIAKAKTQPPLIASPTLIRKLEADLALQRGGYEEALAAFQALYGEGPSAELGVQIGQLLRVLGRPEEGRAQVTDALAYLGREPPEVRAWVALQQGLFELEEGSAERALPHYRRANGLLGGWYLVEEHIAEALAATGEEEEAIVLYEAVIARTENPELMGALADVLRDTGGEDAEGWDRRATARFDAWLEAVPEAAYGHALEFFLTRRRGANALRLAEQNHALRPNGEAKLRLAQALHLAGHPERAEAAIRDALSTPYVSAELFATGAIVLFGEEAAELRRKALERDSAIFDELAWLDRESEG